MVCNIADGLRAPSLAGASEAMGSGPVAEVPVLARLMPLLTGARQETHPAEHGARACAGQMPRLPSPLPLCASVPSPSSSSLWQEAATHLELVVARREAEVAELRVEAQRAKAALEDAQKQEEEAGERNVFHTSILVCCRLDMPRRLRRKRQHRWPLPKTCRQCGSCDSAAMCRAVLLEVSLHEEKELLERLDAEEEETKADAALLPGDDVFFCFCGFLSA